MANKNPSNKDPQRFFKFAQAIASGHTQVESVKLAGYLGSPSTLAVTASRLLKNAKVTTILQAIKKPAMEEAVISAANWLQETSDTIKMASKPFDKLKGLELLGRYFALFTDKHEVTVQTPEIKIESSNGNALFNLTVGNQKAGDLNNSAASVSGKSDTKLEKGNK